MGVLQKYLHMVPMNIKELQLNERAKILNKKLTACRSVKRVLTQKGWREVLQPLLEAMINDVVGYKQGNKYINGALCKPQEINYEYFIGYKQALMDFNNRAWNYVDSMGMINQQIKNLEAQARGEEKYINPMMEGPYAAES